MKKRMPNIYERREAIKIAFVVVSVLLVGAFIFISNSLMKSLEAEERSKMEIWAEATRQVASSDLNSDMSLVLKVIESNTTIPVIHTDAADSVLWIVNMSIPTKDTITYLDKKIRSLKQKHNLIQVDISDETKQFLYYDDSILLKRLLYYPYIQLLILALFIIIAYYAFSSSKKAEQNQVWVGLSKETAHQLGTPISSLIAWIEYLRTGGEATSEILTDMEKDVVRLNTIADRFSKIGSQPKLETTDLVPVLEETVAYMRKRVSSKVNITTKINMESAPVDISKPLFEWVIENLCKNSVDATAGKGSIDITMSEIDDRIVIEVTDNGKGIPKKKFNTVFQPGYTTKKRGWGLGLTLVKRIIEEYHTGLIYVKESVPGSRTTFRIELPYHKS